MTLDSADESRDARRQDVLQGLRKKLARLAAPRSANAATADSPLPSAVCRLPTADCRPPSAVSPLPSAVCPLPSADTPPPGAIVYRRDLPREAPRPVPPDPGICIPLEQCVRGRVAPRISVPPFYLIEGPATASEAHAAALAEALPRALASLPLPDAPPLAPQDACFLDIETTGLGTAVVFLIGTLAWRDGALVCRQFLARSYAEEVSILDAFADEARDARLLVTFNGKTFDVPSLRARAAAAGVALPEVPLHFDLLHAARRRYAETLPDCRLQTLERCVCRRHRVGDIAGADIGRAYHDFVRTGDARELALIVQHNRHDLLTVAELMARILLTRDS